MKNMIKKIKLVADSEAEDIHNKHEAAA